MLLRGVGPKLAALGVTGVLADPQLKLYDGAGKILAENDDRSAALNQADLAAVNGTKLGTLTLNAKDAALLTMLTPAAYTLQISGADGASGVALIEVYDLPDLAKNFRQRRFTAPTGTRGSRRA